MSKRIRPHPTTDEEFDELGVQFSQALEGESDRGCVLVAASILDSGLETLLRSRMISVPNVEKKCVDPLFAVIGPLGSFGAKVRLARALRFIEAWQYDDLELVREIRNNFAHGLDSADFNDPHVIELTERLVSADHAIRHLHDPSLQGALREKRMKPPTPSVTKNTLPLKKERIRFVMSVTYLAGSLFVFATPSLALKRNEHRDT